MADNLTAEQRQKNMRNIRSINTGPEKIIAKELRRRKIYFAQHAKELEGKPDFVFRRKKIAVFIDSDFWHGNPKRCVMPKTNKKYWHTKIESNVLRDKRVNRLLRNQGWMVIRIWEHGVKKHLNQSISRITQALKKRA